METDVVFKRGGGAARAIGLVFMLAGLAFALLPLSAAGRFKPELLIPVAFGGLFALVGSLFVFWTGEVRIDTVMQRWSARSSWLFIGRRREGALAELTEVALSKEIRRTKNSTYAVYPVRITCAMGKPLALSEHQDYGAARAAAERAAKAAGIPLRDLTAEAPRLEMPAELDLSLASRARAGLVQLDDAPEPAGARSKVEREAGRVIVVLRGVASSGSLTRRLVPGVMGLGAIVAFGLVVGLLVFRAGAATPFIAFGLIGGFLVTAGVLTLLVRETLTADAAALHMVSELGPLRKEVRIGAESIEDVSLHALGTSGSRIAVRTTNETFTFGASLSREEQAWIASLMRRALAGK